MRFDIFYHYRVYDCMSNLTASRFIIFEIKKVGDQNASKKGKKTDNSMIISYLNCYAAGIFFATCILHMLPEISEKMKNEIMKGIAFKIFRTKNSIKIFFGQVCHQHQG